MVVATSGVDAQTYYCSRPSEPYIPSGYLAEYDQMERSKREIEQYIDEMNDYLSCLATEHSDASDEANRVVDEWDSAVRSLNNR